jgi:hypothetical protein
MKAPDFAASLNEAVAWRGYRLRLNPEVCLEYLPEPVVSHLLELRRR